MDMKIVGIIVAIIIIVLIVWGVMSSKSTPVNPATPQAATPVIVTESQPTTAAPAQPTATPTGLQVQDSVVGTGAEAKAGDIVTVQYTGTLTNGTKFDSSYDRPGQPFRFPLGAGMVIKGWDLGVVGMKEGGKRHLVIAADLAYGAASPSPLIPANSTLVFDVELLKVEHAQ